MVAIDGMGASVLKLGAASSVAFKVKCFPKHGLDLLYSEAGLAVSLLPCR